MSDLRGGAVRCREMITASRLRDGPNNATACTEPARQRWRLRTGKCGFMLTFAICTLPFRQTSCRVHCSSNLQSTGSVPAARKRLDLPCVPDLHEGLC